MSNSIDARAFRLGSWLAVVTLLTLAHPAGTHAQGKCNDAAAVAMQHTMIP